jgi:hypothetical protein
MSGYLKTNMVVRFIAASCIGVASLIGGIAIAFVALAFADAGTDLSLAVVLGLLVGVLFVAAFVMTRVLTEAPRGWAVLFVGLGGCGGMSLSEWLAPWATRLAASPIRSSSASFSPPLARLWARMPTAAGLDVSCDSLKWPY